MEHTEHVQSHASCSQHLRTPEMDLKFSKCAWNCWNPLGLVRGQALRDNGASYEAWKALDKHGDMEKLFVL